MVLCIIIIHLKETETFFSEENAKRIDFIRDKIDEWYENHLIIEEEKLYLIGCLLESISKVSNVPGVYASYFKTWDVRALKKCNSFQ